jgi:hypothetical protein
MVEMQASAKQGTRALVFMDAPLEFEWLTVM